MKMELLKERTDRLVGVVTQDLDGKGEARLLKLMAQHWQGVPSPWGGISSAQEAGERQIEEINWK